MAGQSGPNDRHPAPFNLLNGLQALSTEFQNIAEKYAECGELMRNDWHAGVALSLRHL